MSGDARSRGAAVNGWLVIDKPLGLTSTQVVGRVRRILKPRKIGHGGTLDPLASGLLPIALGEATKTVSYVMDGRKSYRFTLRWGQATETDDAEGAVIEEHPHRPESGIDFVSQDLNRLRRALIDAMAGNAELDTEGVKCHLSNQGFSGLLATLLAPEVYVHGRFARPDASAEVARQSVLHILGVLRDRQTGSQRAEEARALAADMTADRLKQVQARLKLQHDEEGRKVDLDRFEAMLQRTADKANS